METGRNGKKGNFIYIVVAGVSPFVVMSIYLYFSRVGGGLVSEYGDICAILISQMIGVFCVFRLPFTLMNRVALAFAYIVVFTFLLIMYSLNFVGIVFDNWL